jgi:tetratricopeptide (TPR) repeat protein
VMLNKLERSDEAIQAAEQCLNYRRNYAGAYFEIGSAYKKLGNEAKAREYFQKCLNDRAWQSAAQWELDYGLKEAFRQ